MVKFSEYFPIRILTVHNYGKILSIIIILQILGTHILYHKQCQLYSNIYYILY